MSHKVYRGFRYSGRMGGQLVMKYDDILDPNPSQKVWNHSPDGFNWGYGGSGPAQLALALLLDVTADKERSVKYHQKFKRAFVAGWGNVWEITEAEITTWLESQGGEW